MSRVLSALTSPRMLGLHALAIVLTAAAVLLGIWQYHAWGSNRVDQALELSHSSPVAIGSVMTADSAFPGDAVGQPVTLEGRWLPQDTVYVSGKHLHGHAGYWVVTPVAVCDPSGPATASADTAAACATKPAMLVVRGFTRSIRPAPTPPAGAVHVSGWLQPAEGTGVLDRHPRDDVLPQLRIVDAMGHVRQDLYGAYVIDRSTGGTPGIARVTPGSLPKPDTFTAIRNLLYAIEWWVFAGFALFLWWRWCRDEIEHTGGDATHVPPGPEPATPGVASKT